jgi:hypothetical protein
VVDIGKLLQAVLPQFQRVVDVEVQRQAGRCQEGTLVDPAATATRTGGEVDYVCGYAAVESGAAGTSSSTGLTFQRSER